MNSAEILDRLISFPTVSRDSNLSLIEFVRDFLAQCGVASKLYHDATGRKANLFASIGPTEQPGMLLSGHTDVVPVDGQTWSSSPFQLKQRGERLYARGAADMKGFLACALHAAQRATRQPLRMPLQLAFSYDEEVGCLGVRSLIADMSTWSHRPRFCIVGEPTMLRSAVGHKGKTALKAACHGRAAHSACPDLGVNAIYLASDLIARIRERQTDIAHSGTRDPAYDVPYTTLHVGVIQGGTVLNIVPEHCEIEFEIRNLPADDPRALVDALRGDAAQVVRSAGAHADTGIAFDIGHEYPALETAADAEVVELAAQLTGNRERIKVGFGTEGGLFSGQLGIPTVVCGPGSIDQAHKPDEFIATEQLQRCDAMMTALLDRLI
ncbi:MAG TPA: acetylornithine deacetylase [Steroidobacteraceae bacterium]|jgi:acetylornithine deacetylase|nr:acetylornithine deacetylase [Steroidobacteraceae bacterium]